LAYHHLVYHVSQICQQDMNYCWACAFAMLLGRHSWQAALDIAERVPVAARDVASGALLPSGLPTAASALGFSCSPAAGLTPRMLASRMRSGPVGVFGNYRTANTTGGHVTVVSRFIGNDADTASVQLTVHDPREGSAWTGPWSGFLGPALRSADTIVGRW
jgi:hypothetical protein